MSAIQPSNAPVENAQNRILNYIKEQGFQYNSILPKCEEMAQILGVSRTVVREAYCALRSMGFIKTIKKKGTVFVKPSIFGSLKDIASSGLLDQETIGDLYDLRIMLEIGMVDLVMTNRTDEKIIELLRIVDAEEKTDDRQKKIEYDVQFHSTLYSITGNKSLEYFQYVLKILFSYYNIWGKKYNIISHRALVELLNRGDIELFRAAMRMHLDYHSVNKIRNLSNIEIKH